MNVFDHVGGNAVLDSGVLSSDWLTGLAGACSCCLGVGNLARWV